MYRMIWNGMREITRRGALFALVFAIFASFFMFLTGFRLNWPSVTLCFAILACIFWACALWILTPRCVAYFAKEGWRCEKCGEWIGLTDDAEAFRLRGVLGSLPDRYEAFIVCQRKHRTPIRWSKAFNEMRTHLNDLAAAARDDAVSRTRDEDAESQSIRKDSAEFAKRSSSLLRNAQLGEHAYVNINDLRSNLRRYANREWPKGRAQRNSLYELIMRLKAYQQIFEQAEDSMKRDPKYRLLRTGYEAVGGDIQQEVFLPNVAAAAQLSQEEFGYALDYLIEQRLIIIETNDGWGRITRQGVSWMKKYEETPDETPVLPSVPPTQENTFYGPVGAVQGPNSYADVQQNIGADFAEVLNCLAVIRQRIQQLPPANRQEALQTVDEVEQGIRSPNPPRGMIKSALRSLANSTKDKVIETAIEVMFKHLGISG